MANLVPLNRDAPRDDGWVDFLKRFPVPDALALTMRIKIIPEKPANGTKTKPGIKRDSSGILLEYLE